jgi:peptide/nickel transport system permease protein
MAIITRMMRSSLVETMSEEYVDAARAKGLPEKLVLRRHARRNALIPTVTVIGLSFGFLLQGTVVVEIIFRWPGLGRWMADAVLRGDQATIMAYVMFTSVLFLVVNLAVDVMYAYLDRRVVLGT